MNCKHRLESYLRENGLPYQSQHHPRAITAQEVAATEHAPGKMFAKTVMVLATDEQKSVMLVLAAPYHVNTQKAGAALGAREVLLAEEKRFADTFPDCEVGTMPPFGSLYDISIYADKTLAKNKTIVFRAGTHTDTMRVEYADFERLVRPTVAEFAEAPTREQSQRGQRRLDDSACKWRRSPSARQNEARMHVWRYELGTWVEEDVALSERHPFLPEGYDHSPFMTLGDTSPGSKGMSVAAHETLEGSGYLIVVFAGEEAMDPMLVSDLPSLLDLLGKLAPIVSASQI